MNWNPFEKKEKEGAFVEHKLRIKNQRRNHVTAFFGVVAIFGWIYVFISSGIFEIKNINSNNLTTLTKEEVTSAVYRSLDEEGRGSLLGSRNILFINEDLLIEDLKNDLFLENIIVDKVFPQSLKITITERQNKLVLLHDNLFYLLDRHGFITEEILGESEQAVLTRLNESSGTSTVPIIKIREVTRLVPGELFVSETRMQTWLQAFEDLKKAGFGYRNAVLQHTTSTKLILNMFEPYEVYYDLLEPLPPQIASFYEFMKLRDQNIPIHAYVDARIPGKVFYK